MNIVVSSLTGVSEIHVYRSVITKRSHKYTYVVVSSQTGLINVKNTDGSQRYTYIVIVLSSAGLMDTRTLSSLTGLIDT